mgnify:CR=1 FL=1
MSTIRHIGEGCKKHTFANNENASERCDSHCFVFHYQPSPNLLVSERRIMIEICECKQRLNHTNFFTVDGYRKIVEQYQQLNAILVEVVGADSALLKYYNEELKKTYGFIY